MARPCGRGTRAYERVAAAPTYGEGLVILDADPGASSAPRRPDMLADAVGTGTWKAAPVPGVGLAGVQERGKCVWLSNEPRDPEFAVLVWLSSGPST